MGLQGGRPGHGVPMTGGGQAGRGRGGEQRGDQYLALYGALLSTAAYTAAGDGDRTTANTLVREATAAARRIGDDGVHGQLRLPHRPPLRGRCGRLPQNCSSQVVTLTWAT
ncbi:MAG TPA: hypothetical protein VGD67_05555 [Pseudonocardiaceae bacterium]